MKLSPLSFNKIEYNRNILVVGDLPEAPLSHHEDVGEFWSEQIKSSEPLSENYKVIKLDKSILSDFKDISNADLLDEFVDRYLEGNQKSKTTLVIVKNINSWENFDLIEALLSGGRKVNITTLIEPDNLAQLPDSTINSIFANTACIVFGHLKEETKEFFEDNDFFATESEVERVLSLKDAYWAMVFADAASEEGRSGLYIYEWFYQDYPKGEKINLDYGEPFELRENITYDFLDFELDYLGDYEHDYMRPGFAGSRTYKKFMVYRKDTKTRCILNWSSGTGLLVPLRFAIGDKVFAFKPWEEIVKVVEEKDFSYDD